MRRTSSETQRWNHTLIVGSLSLLAVPCSSSATGLGADSCVDRAPISLSVGESVQFEGASAATLCVSAASGEEDFLLVTSLLAESSTVAITLESENLLLASGPPNPSPPRSAFHPTAPGPPVGAEPRIPNNGLHTVLRERERRELTSRIVESVSGSNRFPPPRQARPQVPGDLIPLNAQSESACEDPKLVTGRVELVSSRAIVVADTANPSGGFGQAFAAAFDTLVAPVTDEHFGVAGDIDGNGKVIIFFTKEVNALNLDDGSFTAGFFFSRDLFPVVSPGAPLGSCGTSNEAELLYLLVPDPQGVAGQAVNRGEAEQLTIVTMAHEYQHLVNASQRLLGTATPRPFEEAWLNEALSHAAEELLFYRTADLSPRMDLGIGDFSPGQIGALNDFQRLNFLRLLEFLKAPEGHSPFDPDVSLATRGAGWSFLRYSADRVGEDDAVFLRRLVDSSLTGLDNLADALGGGRATLFDWLGDWSVGLYADDRVASIPLRFQNLSWDNFSLFAAGGFRKPYIATSSIFTGDLSFRDLAAGGSSYFRFAAAAGQVGKISLRTGGSAPPPSLRATILRTR